MRTLVRSPKLSSSNFRRSDMPHVLTPDQLAAIFADLTAAFEAANPVPPPQAYIPRADRENRRLTLRRQIYDVIGRPFTDEELQTLVTHLTRSGKAAYAAILQARITPL
jgi:hypothetical protein